ncbi:carbohydrate-binding protein [Paenibacillus roseipurpureus]|uniref:Carbohydrate-binding protein n=1 Tax=Paenibacillus roseopurpureus TaxID=2918901 RepID=A0AA96LQG9_9BACL|nr:carbohydrate-binding protein [Paenibacillus sp. MBLB1832]WNR45284.1 carbohydrate-binding protein [Paenibacillus sp. MBLB1832]
MEPRMESLWSKCVVVGLLACMLLSMLVLPAKASVNVLRVEGESYSAGYNISKTSTYVGWFDAYDWVRYDNLDMTGYTELKLNANFMNANTKIDVILDAADTGTSTTLTGGMVIGTMNGTTPDVNGTTFTSRTIKLNQQVSGFHKVYLRFLVTTGGSASGLGSIDWLEFSKLAPTLIQAESYSAGSGVTRQPTYVGYIDAYDWVRYDIVNLTGYTDITFNASITKGTTKIDVLMDATDSGGVISGGTKIGSLEGAVVDKDSNTYSLRTISLNQQILGVHKLYFRFLVTTGGSASGLGNLDWFELSRTPPSNADLKQLTVSAGMLQPAFSSSVTAYTLTVTGGSTSQVQVTPQTSDATAYFTFNNTSYKSGSSIALDTSQVGQMRFTVVSEEGREKVYTIAVQRRNDLMYYVADSSIASDTTGTGSSTAPWRTLANACANAPEGSIIQVLEGNYDETSPCLLKSGTSIQGQGTTKTKIFSKITHDMQGSGWNYDENKFLIQVRNGSNATISDLSINGRISDSSRSHAGIFLHDSSRMLIHDVEITDFDFTAIWIANVTNVHIYNAELNKYKLPTDNTWNRSGNIMLGDATDTTIHDLKVYEDRGGDGMATMRYGWKMNPYQQFPPGTDYYLKLVRVLFYNLNIDVRQQGLWGNGQPGIAIELWSADPTDTEISHSTINDNLSIAGSNKSGQAHSVRIHHNDLTQSPRNGSIYSYAIEAINPNIEIDHNYIKYGYYPIADFSPDKRSGHFIHDNIFDRLEGIDVLHYRGGVSDTKFINNIVVLDDNVRDYEKGNYPFMILGGGTADNITISSNILYEAGTYNNGLFVKPQNASAPPTLGANFKVSSNLFFNWSTYGTTPSTSNPLLDLKRFRLSSGTPVYGLGFHDIQGVPIPK